MARLHRPRHARPRVEALKLTHTLRGAARSRHERPAAGHRYLRPPQPPPPQPARPLLSPPPARTRPRPARHRPRRHRRHPDRGPRPLLPADGTPQRRHHPRLAGRNAPPLLGHPHPALTAPPPHARQHADLNTPEARTRIPHRAPEGAPRRRGAHSPPRTTRGAGRNPLGRECPGCAAPTAWTRRNGLVQGMRWEAHRWLSRRRPSPARSLTSKAAVFRADRRSARRAAAASCQRTGASRPRRKATFPSLWCAKSGPRTPPVPPKRAAESSEKTAAAAGERRCSSWYSRRPSTKR